MRGNIKIRLLIGAIIIIFSYVKYCSRSETNEFTGKKQHISLTTDEEIAIGLQSAPEMAQQHGGLHPDQEAQDLEEVMDQLAQEAQEEDKAEITQEQE